MGNTINFFPKNFKQYVSIKNWICAKQPSSMNMRPNVQGDILKAVAFSWFEFQNATFHVVYRDLDILPIFQFCLIYAVQKVFCVHFFAFITKTGLKYVSHHPKRCKLRMAIKLLSRFYFAKNSKNWENDQDQNFPRVFLFSKRRNICKTTLADGKVCKISTRYLEKRMSFAILDAKKDTLTMFIVSQHFQTWSDVGRLKSVVSQFCPLLTKLA